MSHDVGSSVQREHRARITWSASQLATGLPVCHTLIDPAWPFTAVASAEGWSLACRFVVSPREQGNPTEAWVRFWMDTAPHGELTAGACLRLFERGGGGYAVVEVLD